MWKKFKKAYQAGKEAFVNRWKLEGVVKDLKSEKAKVVKEFNDTDKLVVPIEK